MSRAPGGGKGAATCVTSGLAGCIIVDIGNADPGALTRIALRYGTPDAARTARDNCCFLLKPHWRSLFPCRRSDGRGHFLP